ncbi:hypothetical protein EG835_03790 [bacterium]|nr:hypothetical protein [bacterium]
MALQSGHAASVCEPHFGAVFDAGLTDFYGWTVPKDFGLLAGIAIPGGHAAPGHAEATHVRFLEVLRGSGFSIGPETARASAPISRPTSLTQLCPGRDDVLLVGEAAGFISPSSAEGISYALISSAALADALASGLADAGARYRASVAPLALKVGVKGAKGAAIYGRLTRRAIMRSGIMAVCPLQPLLGEVASGM